MRPIPETIHENAVEQSENGDVVYNIGNPEHQLLVAEYYNKHGMLNHMNNGQENELVRRLLEHNQLPPNLEQLTNTLARQLAEIKREKNEMINIFNMIKEMEISKVLELIKGP